MWPLLNQFAFQALISYMQSEKIEPEDFWVSSNSKFFEILGEFIWYLYVDSLTHSNEGT
jgi:hypothetical protein